MLLRNGKLRERKVRIKPLTVETAAPAILSTKMPWYGSCTPFPLGNGKMNGLEEDSGTRGKGGSIKPPLRTPERHPLEREG